MKKFLALDILLYSKTYKYDNTCSMIILKFALFVIKIGCTTMIIAISMYGTA